MAGPGNHQFMLGDTTKLTIATIGQNIKNMGQNLFTRYSPQRNYVSPVKGTIKSSLVSIEH